MDMSTTYCIFGKLEITEEKQKKEIQENIFAFMFMFMSILN